MTERERIGMLIAEKRNEAGLSIRELAKISGVHFSNIEKIEGGMYNVSIDILSKIANVLECEIVLDSRSPLMQFVFDNQDRGDIIGDLCHDLIRDNDFISLKTEEEQKEKIISVGNWHFVVREAVTQLFEEYNGEEVLFDE